MSLADCNRSRGAGSQELTSIHLQLTDMQIKEVAGRPAIGQSVIR
jgi:hypothetical protein